MIETTQKKNDKKKKTKKTRAEQIE